MKLWSFSLAVANAIVLLAVSFVVAQDDVPDPMAMVNGAPVNGGLLDCCCCDQSGWIFGAEATFFRYGRTDGMRVGVDDGEGVRFGLELSPRFTVGYVGCDGFGARVRYWEFDHSEPAGEGGGSGIAVDTYTIDFEIFQMVQVGACTTVEWSAGIRYNEFDEFLVDAGWGAGYRINAFNGWGGIVGAQVTREFCGIAAYGRFRYAILMDDKETYDEWEGYVKHNDSVLAVTELGMGVAATRCLRNGSTLIVNAGVEWQQWQNYSSNFDIRVDEDSLDGHSDVGFFGLVLGATLIY